MRRRRPFLLLLSLGATMAACTSLLGDFTSGSGGSADGGPDTSTTETSVGESGADAADSGAEGTTGTVSAVPVGGSVFLSQKATADGTKSTPSPANGGTYAWQLGAPAGSTLTTADLQGSSTATVTFTPDVVGEYKLELTVSAFGTTSSNATSVFAVLPQVFYAHGQIADAGSGAWYEVVDYDGGNVHAVTCPDNVVTSVPNEIATYGSFAGRAYDFWESPSEPSRLAGFTMNYQAGVGYSTELYVTTSASSCDGGGVQPFPSSTFGPGRPYGSTPRFSPDGSRIAVYDDKWNIVTYPGKGTTPVNTVAKYPISFGQSGLDPSGAAALNDYVVEPPRIEWIRTTGGTVMYSPAWAAPQPLSDGGLGWAILSATDGTGSTVSTYMTCSGMTPRQFAVLSDGSVIASYRQSATGPEDLVHLGVSNGQCNVVRNYTTLPNNVQAVATDFDVSPDESTIAYLAIDPTTQDAGPWAQGTSQLPGGYAYTVPVTGGTPTQIAVNPMIYGPRFVGAGQHMVMTALDHTVGGSQVGSGGQLATSVILKKVTGGPPRVVIQGDGVSSFVSSSGSGACSASSSPGTTGGGAAAAALAALVGVAGLFRVRRRRAAPLV